jgi:hypothetical protein
VVGGFTYLGQRQRRRIYLRLRRHQLHDRWRRLLDNRLRRRQDLFPLGRLRRGRRLDDLEFSISLMTSQASQRSVLASLSASKVLVTITLMSLVTNSPFSARLPKKSIH